MSPPDDSCPAWLRLTMWLTYSLSWGLLILFDLLMDRCLRMSSANTLTTGTCYLLPWLQVGTSCSFKNQSSGSVIVFKHLPEQLCSLISDQIIDYQTPPPHSHVAHLLLAVAVVVGCVAVSEIVDLSLVALHEVAVCLPSWSNVLMLTCQLDKLQVAGVAAAADVVGFSCCSPCWRQKV